MGKETESSGTDNPKLVRHKIPAIIKKRGEILVFHIANEKEYYFALRGLFNEKAAGLLSADTRQDFINEAADVLDILESMIDLAVGKNRMSFEDIENMRSLKQAKEGRFSRRVILDKINKV